MMGVGRGTSVCRVADRGNRHTPIAVRLQLKIMRLHLQYKKGYNHQLLKKNLAVPAVRVVGELRFVLSDGHRFSESVEYVLDTGSPYVVVPKSLWSGIWKGKQKRHAVIHPGMGGKLEGAIAEVKLLLQDAQKRTPSILIRAKAFLAKSDDVPLIVGFHSVLENFVFHSNYPQKQVYLETF
jgi:hypothetical protein